MGRLLKSLCCGNRDRFAGVYMEGYDVCRNLGDRTPIGSCFRTTVHSMTSSQS